MCSEAVIGLIIMWNVFYFPKYLWFKSDHNKFSHCNCRRFADVSQNHFSPSVAISDRGSRFLGRTAQPTDLTFFFRAGLLTYS